MAESTEVATIIKPTFACDDPSTIPKELFRDFAVKNDLIEKIEFAKEETQKKEAEQQKQFDQMKFDETQFYNKKDYDKKEEEKKEFFNALQVIADTEAAEAKQMMLNMIAELREKIQEQSDRLKEAANQQAGPADPNQPKQAIPEERQRTLATAATRLDILAKELDALEKEGEEINTQLKTEKKTHGSLWRDALSKAKSAFLDATDSNWEDVFKAMATKLGIINKEGVVTNEAEKRKLEVGIINLNQEVAESLSSRASVPDMVARRQADWNAAYLFEVQRRTKEQEVLGPVDMKKIQKESSDVMASEAVRSHGLMAELQAAGKAFQLNKSRAYTAKGEIRPDLGIVPKDKSDSPKMGGVIQSGIAYAESGAMKAYKESLYTKKGKNEKGETVTLPSEAAQSAKKIIGLEFKKVDNAVAIAQVKQKMDEVRQEVSPGEKPKESPSAWSRFVNAVKDLASRITSSKKEAAELGAKSGGPSPSPNPNRQG